MKIGKFTVNRNGIHWVSFRDLANGGIAIDAHRIPAYPAQFGNVVAITPGALVEDEGGEGRVVFRGVERCLRNAHEVHHALRAKGKRGLNLTSLRFYYTPPGQCASGCDEACKGLDHANILIGWKAPAA